MNKSHRIERIIERAENLSPKARAAFFAQLTFFRLTQEMTQAGKEPLRRDDQERR